jgi:hypothetical protein
MLMGFGEDCLCPVPEFESAGAHHVCLTDGAVFSISRRIREVRGTISGDSSLCTLAVDAVTCLGLVCPLLSSRIAGKCMCSDLLDTPVSEVNNQ